MTKQAMLLVAFTPGHALDAHRTLLDKIQEYPEARIMPRIRLNMPGVTLWVLADGTRMVSQYDLMTKTRVQQFSALIEYEAQ